MDARIEPAEVAHAAHDHHHDEGPQGEVGADVLGDAAQRSEEHAGCRRHAGADREDGRVHERDRDAHGLRHDPVLRGRADPDAVLPVAQEEVEGADDGRGEHRRDDPVPGVLEVEEGEVSRERLLDAAGGGAPLPERVFLEHERDAEGGEDRLERIAPDERPERRHLEHRAEDRDHHRGDEQRQPEVARGRDRDGPDEAAQHDEVAVGEVDHVHDAEDERQARGHQGQDHAVDDAVDGLDEDLLEPDAHGG